MRYAILVLSLSATLCAQAPPVQTPNQQPAKPPEAVEPGKPAVQPWEIGQSKPDLLGVTPAPGKSADKPVPTWRLLPSEHPQKPPSSKWKLFSFGRNSAAPNATLRLFPDTGGTESPFVNRGLAPGNNIVIHQQGPCAIPLTNVLPPSGTTSKIRRAPIPDGQFPIKEARPPAPSCNDRK